MEGVPPFTFKSLKEPTMSKSSLSTLVKQAASEVYGQEFTCRKRGEYIYIASRLGTEWEYHSNHKIDRYRDHDHKYAELLCDYHAMARSYYDN
jgi:hypothetical protein